MRPRRRKTISVEILAWIRWRTIWCSLAGLVVGAALLESKNAGIAGASGHYTVSVQTALVTGYGAQGLANAVALILGATMAAARSESMVPLMQWIVNRTKFELLLNTLTIAAWIGILCGVAVVAGTALGVETSARAAGIHPPIFEQNVVSGLRTIARDTLGYAVLCMIGALIGSAARRRRSVFPIIGPLAVLCLEQINLLYVRFPLLGQLASVLPGALIITALEGTAGTSDRSSFHIAATRSPWIGIVGLCLWAFVTGFLALRTQLDGASETGRAAGAWGRLAAVVISAGAIGLAFPPLFATEVPWRYQTSWLQARSEHRSSIDVVTRFSDDVRHAKFHARSYLAVRDVGADPLTDRFYEPLRNGHIKSVGPESNMTVPDRVPVEVVRHGEVVVTYQFTMIRRGDSWAIRSVDVEP